MGLRPGDILGGRYLIQNRIQPAASSLGALYPCVPNQLSSETERTVRATGNPVTDAVNVTLKSLKDLPTWAKIGIPVAIYLLFGDEIKQRVRRRR